MKVLLCGYYGHRNFGDDLLLRIVADRLNGIEGLERLTILCDSGGWDYISKSYPNASLIDPKDAGAFPFHGYDRVVFGGGGTIFDYREDLSFFYHSKRRLKDFLSFRVARFFGTRFMWLGLGLGPFGDERAKSGSMQKLKVADRIIVRDQISLALLGSKYCRDVAVCADLSLAQYDEIQSIKAKVVPDQNHVLMIVRHFKYGSYDDQYLRNLIAVAERMRRNGLTVSWASYQGEYDQPVLDQLVERGEDVWVWNPLTMPLSEACHQICKANLVVTARMHGIYLAGMLGVPVLGIALHQKLKFAAELFGDMAAVASPEADIDELMSSCTSLLQGNNRKFIDVCERNRDRLLEVFDHTEDWIANV